MLLCSCLRVLSRIIAGAVFMPRSSSSLVLQQFRPSEIPLAVHTSSWLSSLLVLRYNHFHKSSSVHYHTIMASSSSSSATKLKSHDVEPSSSTMATVNNDKYLLTKEEIEKIEGIRKVHFLNPNAIRTYKSLGNHTGLTGIGFHINEVEPGHDTTEYHMHYYEDECVYLLHGTATAEIGNQVVTVQAGDFIGYRKGGLPHKMYNTGTELLRYIVVGERLQNDVADYTRLQKRNYRNLGMAKNIVDYTSIVPMEWGLHETNERDLALANDELYSHNNVNDKYLLTKGEIEKMEGTRKVHFLNPNAIRTYKSLGDSTGLTGFGFHINEIEPGYDSTEYHVHYYEDECVYVLQGIATAEIGSDVVSIKAGDFIGYRKGGLPHNIRNTGTELLRYIVVGERLKHDVADYTRLHKRIYRNAGMDRNVVNHAYIETPEVK